MNVLVTDVVIELDYVMEVFEIMEDYDCSMGWLLCDIIQYGVINHNGDLEHVVQWSISKNYGLDAHMRNACAVEILESKFIQHSVHDARKIMRQYPETVDYTFQQPYSHLTLHLGDIHEDND